MNQNPATHIGAQLCECTRHHPFQMVVLTGGPGAGKTAALELIQKAFCHHMRVLPESAGILFSGGFPRFPDLESRRSAQFAILAVQRELERTASRWGSALVVCDRGVVDGAAYWPGPDDFFDGVDSSEPGELARYAAVIHMRTPRAEAGYNQQNPLRIESVEEALAIDERIGAAWQRHPHRYVVRSAADFGAKVSEVVRIIAALMPACCTRHESPASE